jgi:hypothetical protein
MILHPGRKQPISAGEDPLPRVPLIFERQDRHALTLFVLACWYDMQEDYAKVWTTRLMELSKWVDDPPQGQAGLPQARLYGEKVPHAWQTWQACGERGFATWFTDAVNRIAKKNPKGAGNLRRFIAQLVLELMNTSQQTRNVAIRHLGQGRYGCLGYKRAWMLTMFLRRDQGIIRCLIERSLAQIHGVDDATRLWYDGTTFPEKSGSAAIRAGITAAPITSAGPLFRLCGL